MYGNMTQNEKRINKNDLQAWKHYDNQQYSLIPGINHDHRLAPGSPKRTNSPDPKNKTRADLETAFQRDVHRMGQQGFHHLRSSEGASQALSMDPANMKPYGKQGDTRNPDHNALDAYYHKGRGGVLQGSVPLSSHHDL